jgi:hypothetical protein
LSFLKAIANIGEKTLPKLGEKSNPVRAMACCAQFL